MTCRHRGSYVASLLVLAVVNVNWANADSTECSSHGGSCGSAPPNDCVKLPHSCEEHEVCCLASHTSLRQSLDCSEHHVDNGNFGVIIVGGSPDDWYENNMDCEWSIETDPGTTISFYFTYFDLEGGSSCPWDYVELKDDGSPLTGRMCGEILPDPITSVSNKVVVKFYTDVGVVRSGFSLLYDSFGVTGPPTEECSGSVDLLGDSGVITVGGPDNLYQNNMDCQWRIEADPGTTISFTFTYFDLEDGDKCPWDYVQLEEVGSLLGVRMCGEVLPDPIISVSNQVVVIFHTDASVVRSGFILSYTKEQGSCSVGKGDLSGDSGTITVGGSPSDLYENNLDCEWSIETDPGTAITFTFTYFDLEGGSYCPWDYVQLEEDGISLGHRMCGDVLPEPITSFSNQVVVRFHTDRLVVRSGFILSYVTNEPWLTIPPTTFCSGSVDFSGDFGTITVGGSPGDQYGNNMDCEWRIEVDQGSTISFFFTYFYLEDGSSVTSSCPYDYVQLEEDGSLLGGRMCGAVLPDLITSVSNQVMVRFYTDASVVYSGFILSYVTNDVTSFSPSSSYYSGTTTKGATKEATKEAPRKF